MIERITEARRVEVGRYYFVPCVPFRLEWAGEQFRVPVIGPEHSDAEFIGFERPHWHHDFRFTPTRIINAMRLPDDLRRQTRYLLVAVVSHDEPQLLTWRKMRCLRRMPTYPLECSDGTPIRFMADLERAYATARIKPDCRTCPHRGLPLNGLPVKDGAVVCPGHGLRWNLATGELVRRVPEVQR